MDAWRIWFSPRKTARLIEKLEEENNTLKADNEAISRAEMSIRRENETLALAISDIEVERKELIGKNENIVREKKLLEEENLALRGKLGEYLDTSRRVEEIEEVLGRVEQMKARYEERIHKLREYIKNVKTAPDNNEPGADELLEIDMDGEGSYPNSISARSKKFGGRNREEDWLEDLPY